MRRKRRAVLIFGTFNPITNAHINMGKCAEKEYPDAAILYVPTNKKFLVTDKDMHGHDILSDDVRLSLITQATSIYGYGQLTVEMAGVLNGKTYNTVEYASSRYDPIVCIGADNLSSLDKWYKVEQLVSKYKFLIISRNGSKGVIPESLQKYEENFEFVDGNYPDISATKVREALRDGDMQSVRDMVPICVYNYLIQHPTIFTPGGQE